MLLAKQDWKNKYDYQYMHSLIHLFFFFGCMRPAMRFCVLQDLTIDPNPDPKTIQTVVQP